MALVMGRKRKPLSQISQTSDDSLSSKKKRSSEPLQKRAGTVLHMTLKNFMCHSLLEVDLSENINIIIGRNGSGKSAILTALIVGLGGKASLTNRGNNVRSFVKAGKNSGSVEIQLYNAGPMAYRPNIYGNRITICRNFTATGSSSYKIKSENGEVVATQLREILNITTCLNIQVDNPICILNQDTSRNFLSSSDPKNKFALFMKATRLETLADDYKKTNLNKKEVARILAEKQKNFEKLQDELNFIKKKIDNHRSADSIRDKIKLNQVELLWAKVRDAEEELEKMQEKIGGLERKHENVLSECANKASLVETIRKNIAAFNQQMSELKETYQIQLRPQMDVKKVSEELKIKYNEKKTQKQLLVSAIESKTRDVDILVQEIENVNENMTKVEQEKVERLRTLNNLNEKIKGMDDHLETCRNDLFQISNDTARKNEEKQQLRREISNLDHQMNTERNSLNALKRESGNNLLLYGQDMPKVKQLIEQNKHKFKHVPRGPLGSYIKLKDRKWAIAIESFLGQGLLGAFMVDNASDNQLLLKILNQVCSDRKPMIITSKFFYQKHNVQPNLVEAPSDCMGFYDALEIEDPIVSNCIVDQAGIEGVLLIPSNERAVQLLSEARNVPHNCRQGVTIGGEKYYPDPNYKTYGSNYKRVRFLQVDTKDHIIQLTNSIIELSKRKENLEQQLGTLNQSIQEQEDKKRQLEDKIRNLNSAKSRVRKELENLKATVEPEVANVEFLETELTETRNSLQEKKVQICKVDDELKDIKARLQENEDKLRKLKESNSSLEERMEALNQQIREETNRQKEILTSCEFDQRKVKECEARLNEARSNLVIKQTITEKALDEASNVGERVETCRKVPDIISELNQFEKSLRKIEILSENVDELLTKYGDLQKKHRQVSDLLTCLNEDLNELNFAIEKRSRHYKLTENYFVTFIKHSFKKIMEVRQFQGTIEINMHDKKLELIVIPQQGSQGLTTTSNLSGGERSFSTVAFLYSLWQCMDFPFYFLDEFDVYMDKLNRSKVFDILLHHAETHPELQFVFLTPQDVSFIERNVSILKLQDPERNA